MSVKTLTPALLLLVGLLAGWAVWGRGPDLSKILAENAALQVRVAALARLAVQLDTARYRAVHAARGQIDTVRIEVARADTAAAEASAQLAQGDSAGAIAALTLANHYLAGAVDRCEAAAASLEAAATTQCDAAITTRDITIDAQAERIDELTGDLQKSRPRNPWAVGLVVSERLAPRGLALSRDLGPLVLQGLAVRETVTDSGGRRREELRAYLVGSVRF